MKKILVIAAFMLSLVACKPISEQININDWSLDNPDNLSVGLTQLGFDTNLLLEADNNSAMDIRLTKLYAELYNRSDKLVATVELAKAKGETLPVLHKRSSETVAVPLKMNFENPLSILTLAGKNIFQVLGSGPKQAAREGKIVIDQSQAVAKARRSLPASSLSTPA